MKPWIRFAATGVAACLPALPSLSLEREPAPAIAIAAPATGQAEALSYLYGDDNGLLVSTTAFRLRRPMAPGKAWEWQGLADWIRIASPDPSDPGGGHEHHEGHENHEGHPDHGAAEALPALDGVTGASARASTGGGSAQEWRFQAGAGYYRTLRPGKALKEWSGAGSVSWEPDYQSLSGAAKASVELFPPATVASFFLGAGFDRISPETPPPGQSGLWPARHGRLSGGLSLSGPFSSRSVLSGGVAGAWQSGALESPYRLARIRTTLFPERLPDTRLRGTGFLQLSMYLGLGAALHHREGAYLDSWQVAAWIPETSLSLELGRRNLMVLTHRYYRQSAAAFYAPVYESRSGLQTGDFRLGRIRGHDFGLKFEHTFLTWISQPVVWSEYRLGRHAYPDLDREPVFHHRIQLGMRMDY